MMNVQLAKRILGIPRTQKTTEEDKRKMFLFIHSVMMGSGYETKSYVVDFLDFQKNFRPQWAVEYKKWLDNPKYIPIYGEDGITYELL